MLQAGKQSFALLLLISAGWSQSAGAVQVDLEVDYSTGAPSLIVTRNTAQCAGGPIDCIEVAFRTQPHMFFNLRGACSPTGPEYGLSSFRVTQIYKNWPTPSSPMDQAVADDFCADATSGVVSTVDCGNQARQNQLQIKNFNRVPTSVYYEVEARHCHDSSQPVIYLDPEIRNRGN